MYHWAKQIYRRGERGNTWFTVLVPVEMSVLNIRQAVGLQPTPFAEANASKK